MTHWPGGHPKWNDEDGLALWLSEWFYGYSPRLLPYPREVVQKTKRARRGAGGRPKMTLENRREANPIHDAAVLFPEVVIELELAFPKKKTAVIRDRALELTARIMGIGSGRGEKLRTYLERSRADRRRID